MKSMTPLFLCFVLFLGIYQEQGSLSATEEFSLPWKEYAFSKKSSLKQKIDRLCEGKRLETEEDFAKHGFYVFRQGAPWGVVVYAHPATPHVLYKKHFNIDDPFKEAKKYLTRIYNRDILQAYILEHQFSHMMVPKKWLYLMPGSNHPGEGSMLVVEKLRLVKGGHHDHDPLSQLYRSMDQEAVTELCMILHDLGGCDAWPHNQPFTITGKIAFVDTEHLGRSKGDFLWRITDRLSPEMKEYGLSLYGKLLKRATKFLLSKGRQEELDQIFIGTFL